MDTDEQQQLVTKVDVSPAIRRLQNKPEIPTIDFTVHKTEDGNIVNTKERVVKGIFFSFLIFFNI